MIDFTRVVGFQWDSGNAVKSERNHGVTQSEAEQIFFNDPLVVSADTKHSQGETRFHALGQTFDGRHLMVAFTTRDQGRLIRVLSARDMSRSERIRYDEDA